MSILKITIVMSLIYAASFLAIGFFLFQAVENPLIALIGFCSYLYFNYFVASIWPYELYFQYTPIRTIFPALSIFLFYRYLLRPSSLKKFFMLAAMATSIFWNPETGVFVYFALSCGLAFSQLINGRPLQRRLIDAGKEFLQSGAVLVLILLLFKVYMRLVFGEWPDLGNLFLATHQYTNNDLRILADSASIYIFLIYLISLCLSIRAVVVGRGDRGDITAFFLTVLGMGLITYFMHNGHYSTLAQTGYPAVLLLTLFTERLIKSIRIQDLRDNSARWVQWTRL